MPAHGAHAPAPKRRPLSQAKLSAKQGILKPMAYSKQRAKPSATHVATKADEIDLKARQPHETAVEIHLTATADETATNIETADEMRTEEKADGANEMRTEETTDDMRTEETADAMRTEETGEDVAAELAGDNMMKTIRIPKRDVDVPYSCVRCGHLSFLALCREPEMVWAVRCLHCRLIQPILPIYV